MTEAEKQYVSKMPAEHIKRYGQYFTPECIAEFMCRWACERSSSILDPAVGNSVFLVCARRYNPKATLTGYEIDPQILDYFGNPAQAEIRLKDYLLNGWGDRFDSIVCNPPYGKFQSIKNRNEVLESILRHTGSRYSGYTNLYTMFLLKSIFQLSNKGRLAYIIPSEFFNSQYGSQIKSLLIGNKLLKAVVNFKDDRNIFNGVMTTCCIVFLDRDEKDSAIFYNVQTPECLSVVKIGELGKIGVRVPYSSLKPAIKWRPFLENEELVMPRDLVPVSTFCRVSRGIATGDNDYFCLTQSEIEKNLIPTQYVIECVCRSADVQSPILDRDVFSSLVRSEKKTYVLDVPCLEDVRVAHYLNQGRSAGVDKKYLPSLRRPWCAMEHKRPAPVLLSTACRRGMKVVRNLAQVSSLTTFHSLYVKPEYEQDIDLIFCYLLTPSGQGLLMNNRKKLGNGLDKFQPNDINMASMIDIRKISAADRKRILRIYEEMRETRSDALIGSLDAIFSAYVK